VLAPAYLAAREFQYPRPAVHQKQTTAHDPGVLRFTNGCPSSYKKGNPADPENMATGYSRMAIFLLVKRLAWMDPQEIRFILPHCMIQYFYMNQQLAWLLLARQPP
jgi:hypothetical protein